MNKKTLSIIIPVFNSENTIKDVIEEIKKTLTGKIKFEIILINDGSKDKSYDACRKLTDKDKFIKLVDLSKNFGQHNAILAGLKNCKGDYIVSMDDDLQNPPGEIWKLIDELDKGFDVVFGKFEIKKHSLFKRIGSKFNSIMLNFMMSKPKDLYLSSFFIIKRFVLEEIIKYEGPNPYIWGLILRSTFNIGNTIVVHKERKIGETGYSFVKLLRLFLNGLINFSIKPLRIFFILGLFLEVCSLIAIVVIVVQKLLNPDLAVGWASLSVMILFFSGLNLLAIGLVGEYIGRILLYQNRQTQYLIREKINFSKKDNFG